jgi:hypothetical protein
LKKQSDEKTEKHGSGKKDKTGKRNPRKENVKEMTKSKYDSSDDDSDSDGNVCKINFTHSASGVFAELKLKSDEGLRKVECQLDTGSTTNLIGLRNLKKLVRSPEIKTSKVEIRDVQDKTIKIVGRSKLICVHKGEEFELDFKIVEFDHLPLLSEESCRRLRLIKYCKSIYSNPVSILEEGRAQSFAIMDKYKTVFEGLGKFPGKISLEVDENVKTVVAKPRRISLAYRDKMKAELDRLEESGIIRKVEEPTDWVGNVAIVERNGKIRICLSPQELNKALKRPQNQFNTMEEMLPEMGNAKVVSVLDFSDGFLQLVLDEYSSKLTTFWTPFGRYLFLRMGLGMKPGPEYFQAEAFKYTHDLDGVIMMADDAVIMGRGEMLEEAMKNAKLCENLEIPDKRLQEIREETLKDTTLQKAKKYITKGWPEFITKLPDEVKLYFQYRKDLAIEGELQSYDECLKDSDSQAGMPMEGATPTEYPFQQISMDVMETPVKGGQRKFWVTVDHYSDFYEVDDLSDLTSASVIKICKKNFSLHGILVTVYTDVGKNFDGSEFRAFADTWEFNHNLSSPHHPRRNGKAEATIKIAKGLVKECGSLRETLLKRNKLENWNWSEENEREFTRGKNVIGDLKSQIGNVMTESNIDSNHASDKSVEVITSPTHFTTPQMDHNRENVNNNLQVAQRPKRQIIFNRRYLDFDMSTDPE